MCLLYSQISLTLAIPSKVKLAANNNICRTGCWGKNGGGGGMLHFICVAGKLHRFIHLTCISWEYAIAQQLY